MKTFTLHPDARTIIVQAPTSEEESSTFIEVRNEHGKPVAGIEFSAYDGICKVILGHWPDGEEWVDVADVPLIPESEDA